WAGLWWRRLLRPSDWIGAHAITEWELSRVLAIAFRRQYLIERKKPQKYARSKEAPTQVTIATPATA
ncbi:MAG: hypothetical protein ABSH22_09705, partial [Tepidisphaeraceae bacterium]